MTAKVLLLLAFASHVPTIDVNRSCRGAESAALPADRASAYQRCVRDERTAREQLSTIWSRIPIGSRQLCTDVSTGFSPSYVELLSCLEMEAGGDARVNTQTQATEGLSPSTTTRSGERSAAAQQ
jgi:hypothetical protein